jgi:hypothetical protein
MEARIRFSTLSLVACLLTTLATTREIGAQCLCGPICPYPDSSFDLRIGISPCNNDPAVSYRYVYKAVLRNGAGAPVGNVPADAVWLDFSNCGAGYPSQVFPDGPSDANGNMQWSNNLDFGGAAPCAVAVESIYCPLYTIPGYSYPPLNPNGGVRSPDENGGGFALADLSQFQQAWTAGGPSYQADLNLNNSIDLFDVSLFQQHYTAVPCN